MWGGMMTARSLYKTMYGLAASARCDMRAVRQIPMSSHVKPHYCVPQLPSHGISPPSSN